MVKIHVLRSFRFIYGDKNIYLPAGTIHTLDPSIPAQKAEIDYMKSPSFPYRFFISIEEPVTPTNPGGGTGGNNGGCNGGGTGGGGNTGGGSTGNVIPVLDTPPTNPPVGYIYYHLPTDRLMMWDGAMWVPLTGGGTGGTGGGTSGIIPQVFGDITSNGLTNELTIRPGTIVDSDISPNASIALSKLERNPLDRMNHIGVQPASTIIDFDSRVRANSLDKFAPAQNDVSMGGNRLIHLDLPCEDTDAANKAYVDAKVNNIDLCNIMGPTCDFNFRGYKLNNLGDPVDPKDAVSKSYLESFVASQLNTLGSVRLIANSEIPSLRGLDVVIDGRPVQVGDRILYNGDRDPRLNGVYLVSSGNWIRALDADSGTELKPGRTFMVTEGTSYANTAFVTVSPDTNPVMGVSAYSFRQYTGSGSVLIGDGLCYLNNRIVAKGVPGEVLVTNSGIGLDPTWSGSTYLSILGTVTHGTWKGRPIEIAHGGTGANNKAMARSNLGAAASGVNGDISELVGLTTPLFIDQGGTGACNPADARVNLQAADCINGISTCITQLPNFVGPLGIHQGGTGAIEKNTARFNLSAAKSGSNYDITSLHGLSTPLSISQGGTNATTAPEARVNLGAVGTGLNLGTGQGVYLDTVNQNADRVMRFKTLLQGTGITLTPTGTDITLAVNPATIPLSSLAGVLSIEKGGTNAITSTQALTNLNGVSTAINVGAGTGLVFIDKQGTTLRLRSVRANPGIRVETIGDEIVISPNITAGAGIQLNTVGDIIQIVNMNP
jgi:hypothetical protein